MRKQKKSILTGGRYYVTAVAVAMLASGYAATSQVAETKIAPGVATVEMIKPDVITETVFGYSGKGRSIDGYIAGNGDRCVILFGGIHGNEKGTADLLDRLAAEIADRPDILAPDTKALIIPLLNPDGYEDDIYRDNANGVNLNRNFATKKWVQNPDKRTYAGSRPFSEVESVVLRDTVMSCDPEMMIAIHSQGGVVSPEDGIASERLARWYAEKTGYRYFDEWDYPGTATGWFTEATGRPSITVEVTNHNESDWDINKEALIELMGSEWQP